MFIIYVDESGLPTYKDNTDFCLACIFVHEKEWFRIDNAIEQLKESFPDLLDNDGRIHGKHILNLDVSIEEKVLIFDKLYEAILDLNFKIISCIVVKDALPSQEYDLERIGLTRIFEKSNMFLKYKNKEQQSEGKMDFGLIMFDRQKNHLAEKKVKETLMHLISEGSKFVKNKFIIEEPLFAKSYLKNGLQLSDLMAVAIRRNVWALKKKKKNKLDLFFMDLFDRIKPKFDKSRDGEILGYGLTFYPKSSEKIVRG